MQSLRNIISLLNRYWSILFTGLVLIGISYVLIIWGGNFLQKGQHDLLIGWNGTIGRIHPLFSNPNTIERMLSTLVYRPLISFDENSNPVGDIVESWTLNDDETVYILTLHDDLYWHDGQKITTDDVAFTINTILGNPTLLKKYPFLEDVSIEIVNERTVRFVLSEPFSPFISLLTIGILPKHIWQDLTYEQMLESPYNFNPVGSGSYRIRNIVIKNAVVQSIELESISKDSPVQRLTVEHFKSQADVTHAFKRGDIDTIFDIRGTLFKEFTSWPNVVIGSNPLCNQSISLFFNLRKDDNIGGSDEFRDTLYNLLLINKNYFAINVSPLPKSHWAFDQDLTPPDPGDVRTLHDRMVALALETPLQIVAIDEPQTILIAQNLQTVLAELSIDSTISVISGKELVDPILPNGEFDLLLVPQQFNRDPDQYSFWHSTQIDSTLGGLNVSGYADRRMDKALEDGRTSADIKIRKEAYRVMQERLLLDKPVIFIEYQPIHTISRINNPSLIGNRTCTWGIEGLVDVIK